MSRVQIYDTKHVVLSDAHFLSLPGIKRDPPVFPVSGWVSTVRPPWWRRTTSPSASGPRWCVLILRTRTRCPPPSWTRLSSSPSSCRATTSSTEARWPRAPAARARPRRTATTWWKHCSRCSYHRRCSHSRSSARCTPTCSSEHLMACWEVWCSSGLQILDSFVGWIRGESTFLELIDIWFST